MNNDDVIFAKGTSERKASRYVPDDAGFCCIAPELLRKSDSKLPELSELEVIRHFTHLSQKNFSIDTHFYPLGSCTMKYNPRIAETVASETGFKMLHPMLCFQQDSLQAVQGALEILHTLEKMLCEICGMDAFTSQPMAGAHGELTGILLVAAYHNAKGSKRKNIIVPDSSHGTNPASAAVAGYDVVTVPSIENGEVDLDAMLQAIDQQTAAIMLTCPNTHGLFETQITKIAEAAHHHDALLYYDGANLNALLGKIRPGDLGFDIVHVNVHKTFATPHGGGGPGAGPVGVSKRLRKFLPNPGISQNSGSFELFEYEESIGRVAPFFGNFAILLRSLVYILQLGREGLIDAGEKAVLSANYIASSLKDRFKLQFDRLCMHESVFTLSVDQLKTGIRALDIAKFLIDKGTHAPTVYFPLTVKEAMMIEPTETESKERLDEFISIMHKAADLITSDPAVLKDSPQSLPIRRPDETAAARNIDVRWEKEK